MAGIAGPLGSPLGVCKYNVYVGISVTWDGTANLLSELPSCDMASGITPHKVNAQNNT